MRRAMLRVIVAPKDSMKAAQQVEVLERVAQSLGVTVCYEPMAGIVAGRGGLCRVREQYRIIIDRRLKAPERVQILVDALARFDMANIEMPEAIRTLLQGSKAVERRSA